MTPQKPTTKPANLPDLGPKHLFVVGTGAARSRARKKTWTSAASPAAKLGLMSAANATFEVAAVNPLLTLGRGDPVTKKSTLDPISAEGDQDTTRATEDPATSHAEQTPAVVEVEMADDDQPQIYVNVLKVDENVFGPTFPVKRGKPTTQQIPRSSSPDGEFGPDIAATAVLAAAAMNHHQAPWSSRDPSGDDKMDSTPWSTIVSKGTRRRAIAPTPVKKQPRGSGDKHYTIILRPRERVRMTDVSPKDIKTGVSKAIDSEFKYEKGYRIRIQEATNTIAVDTWQPYLVDHFLNLQTIPTPSKNIPVHAYLAMTEDQVRGVIYGIDPTDAEENLLPNLASTTHWILAARPMGRSSKTALITFEGKKIPRTITYYNCLMRVSPYRRRAMVCTHCHGIGHKEDICPNEQRCPDCGREHVHEEEGGCMGTTPQCKNCGGTHVATDSTCPKWREANKLLRRRVKQIRKPASSRAQVPQARRAPVNEVRDSMQQEHPAQTPKRRATTKSPPPPRTKEHFPDLPKSTTGSAPRDEVKDQGIPHIVQAMKAALKASRSQAPTGGQMETTPKRPGGPVQHKAAPVAQLAQASPDGKESWVNRTEFKSSMEEMVMSIKADLQNTISSVVREILQKELRTMITPIIQEAIRLMFGGQPNGGRSHSPATNKIDDDSQYGLN